MPMFKIVVGPPQSGFCGLGRTEISGTGPKWFRMAVVSICAPPAIARTDAAGSATVSGTGRSSRTNRCRHLARQPCEVALIRVVLVMVEKSRGASGFCTAAAFIMSLQHRRKLGSCKFYGRVMGLTSRGLHVQATLPLAKLLGPLWSICKRVN